MRLSGKDLRKGITVGGNQFYSKQATVATARGERCDQTGSRGSIQAGSCRYSNLKINLEPSTENEAFITNYSSKPLA